VGVTHRVVRSILRIDALAIGIVGVAGQAVVTVDIAYRVSRLISPILFRRSGPIKARL